MQSAHWLNVTLYSIGDAVIATDAQTRVTFMNPVAESLTGWTTEEAAGDPLDAVFHIVNEDTRSTVESPVTKALREGLIVGLANHTLLIAKDGTERPIDDSAAPIRDEAGNVAGVVLVFRDISERQPYEQKLKDSLDYATNIISTLQASVLGSRQKPAMSFGQPGLLRKLPRPRRKKRRASFCTIWAIGSGTFPV